MDRKIYNIVFGTNQLKKVAILEQARHTLNHKGSEFQRATEKTNEMKSKVKGMLDEKFITDNTLELKFYNTLKNMINNCSKLSEPIYSQVIKDKNLNLDRLFSVLNDTKMQMKVHYFLNQRMKRKQHISVVEFAQVIRSLELDEKIGELDFEEKNLIYLQNISLYNPRRIINHFESFASSLNVSVF